MGGAFPLLWILIVVAVAVGAYLIHRNEVKRREEIAGWATHQGLTLSHGKDWGIEREFGIFQCLRTGDDRYAENVMRGASKTRPLCAFDYHYTTYSTDSKGRRQKHHHRFSAIVVRTDLPLRPLLMRPEGFFDKVTEFFGIDDIDFESAQFSREFFVKAPEKRWAFDVLHQATMEFLLAAPRFTVEMAGPWVMARKSGRFKPVEFSGALYVVEGILDRLPGYLVRELRGVDS